MILVDGPLAGHQVTVAPHTPYFQAVDPHAFLNNLHAGIYTASQPPSLNPFNDVITYRIGEAVHRSGRYDGPDWAHRLTRIGWCGPEPSPPQAALDENVPAGLAAQGLIPWSAVAPTELDRTSPLATLNVFDPDIPCSLTITDPYGSLGPNIAECACGWYTFDDVPLERRAQLLRVAHWHLLDEHRRREACAQTIRVVDVGIGGSPACQANPVLFETGWMQGRCGGCGWATEVIEGFRYKPLAALCRAHDQLAPRTPAAGSRLSRAHPAEAPGVLADWLRTMMNPVVSASAAALSLEWSYEPASERDWPSQGGTCAHVCGQNPDHHCLARATTTLTYTLPSGGIRNMPVCHPCHDSETATAAAATAVAATPVREA